LISKKTDIEKLDKVKSPLKKMEKEKLKKLEENEKRK